MTYIRFYFVDKGSKIKYIYIIGTSEKISLCVDGLIDKPGPAIILFLTQPVMSKDMEISVYVKPFAVKKESRNWRLSAMINRLWKTFHIKPD